ncbi:uncharacterized protein LOC124159519 [Ischnura elegans]|uniref:uncharacterized protein LOC124159519 n=1 Tax=Ischnura elegans TaxID=197161 RepID=UPI001ED8B261|nr:uncharacterized protein LOC124159519 [Ischnura elegans]
MDQRFRISGSLLPRHSGQKVIILGKVCNRDPNGMSFDMISSDNTTVTVKLDEPLQEPVEGIVEVHGVGMGRNVVKSENYLTFPPEVTNNFDMAAYNETVVIINTEKNPWRQE